MNPLGKQLWVPLSFVLVFSYLFSFGVIAHHSFHMSHISMDNCPFSLTQESLCVKSISQYLDVLSQAVVLIAILVFSYIAVKLLYLYVQKKTTPFLLVDIPPPLYQTLFSNGILNPKAP